MHAGAHDNLGVLLEKKGQVDTAIACYRRAVELSPNFAEAHCNLGYCLKGKGEFRAALAALRTGHELGSRRQGWPYPSAAWVKQCERCIQLDDLLEATRKGKARPASPAEYVELGDFCRDLKQYPATAVPFYIAAFTADPKLAADLQTNDRYGAAQAAALAGCGHGKDTAGLSTVERAKLRRQALEWLRADLASWTKQLEKGGPQARPAALARLQQWLSDPTLASLRDAAGLAKLPAEERSLWQAFWADVTALRTKAAAAQKQPGS
jgi:serine/threonine-protein kinase